MLANHKGLAKTSATPGKTQLINHFLFTLSGKRDIYVADLPGYGHAGVSKTKRNNFITIRESYIRKRENLVQVFVLIDSRVPPQKNDIGFINKLGEWRIPFTLVFTKADKNKPAAIRRTVLALAGQLQEYWEAFPPYFITSGTKKTGRKELIEYMAFITDQPGLSL